MIIGKYIAPITLFVLGMTKSISSWWFVMYTTIVWTVFIGLMTYGLGNYFFILIASKLFNVSESIIETIKSSGFLQQLFAKRVPGVGTVVSILEAAMVFPSNLISMWMLNTIVIQCAMLIECEIRSGSDFWSTLKTSAGSALAGSLAASIAVLVWSILAAFPIVIGQILTVIEGGVYKFSFGWILISVLLMVIFNLMFGAIGYALAISTGCPAPQLAPVRPPSNIQPPASSTPPPASLPEGFETCKQPRASTCKPRASTRKRA